MRIIEAVKSKRKGVLSMNGNLAYKDERPQELIGGRVVQMSPVTSNHAVISGNIHGIFWSFLKEKGGKDCIPFCFGSTVYLTDQDHFVPDMMVVCDRDKIKSDGVYGAPDLVVEVLSPSTMKNDKSHKKEVYGRCGVREYWLVSPGDKSVEVYLNNGTELIFHNVYTLYPDWQLEDMSQEERAAVETSFKCSLYDDLDIQLEDVFIFTF